MNINYKLENTLNIVGKLRAAANTENQSMDARKSVIFKIFTEEYLSFPALMQQHGTNYFSHN
jgi:hypothetical protein